MTWNCDTDVIVKTDGACAALLLIHYICLTYEPHWSPVIILFTRARLRVTLLLLGGLICMNNGAVLCDTEKIRIHHPDTGRTPAPSAAIISWHLPRVTPSTSHITPTLTTDEVILKYFSEISANVYKCKTTYRLTTRARASKTKNG